MKKAELEAHYEAYESRMRKARAAEHEGLYREAIAEAISAWDYVDGMMQYQNRYAEREFSSVLAIEIVLKYAPLLLDFITLDRLEELLRSYRRIEKKTSESMAEKLASARQKLWENHCLWSHLERFPGSRQDELRRHLSGNQDYWRSVTESWEKMGLLTRIPNGGSYQLFFATRMDVVVSGKCSYCGLTAEAPKAMFLESMKCPQCHHSCMFVILQENFVTEHQD